jgi:archaellum component FlaC
MLMEAVTGQKAEYEEPKVEEHTLGEAKTEEELPTFDLKTPKRMFQLPTAQKPNEESGGAPEEKEPEPMPIAFPEYDKSFDDIMHETPTTLSQLPELTDDFSDKLLPEMEPVESASHQTVEKQEFGTGFSPLFIKIEKYKQILNAMNYLKNTVMMVKNTYAVHTELEKLRAENLDILKDAIDKLDKKLLTLDSEFMRPSGYVEHMAELHDVHSIATAINDLRSQVEELRQDLKTIA